MSMLSRLHAQARYNVLTPVFMLSLAAASPAIADDFDRVITAPVASVELDANDSLTNRSIIGDDAVPAVFSAHDIRFITNELGAEINGGSQQAIFIDGSVQSITNAGLITSTDYYGVQVIGDLGTFTNSGTIETDDTGLEVDGNIGTFTNTGRIESDNATGVEISGDAELFINRGTISGQSYGVYVAGHAKTFINSGEITSITSFGIGLGSVDNFNNSGYIQSENSSGVFVDDKAGSFINSGEIYGFENGVLFAGTVDVFENSGTIAGVGNGVYFAEKAGAVINTGAIGGALGTGLYLEGGVNTLGNSGTITGDGYGIYVGGVAGILENIGTIAGATGVRFDGSYTLFLNTGTIGGETRGVSTHYTSGTFANNGTISASAGDGAYFEQGIAVFNNGPLGEISGSESGVYIGGLTGEFYNAGLIEGDYGVYSDGGVNYFSNSGLISADEVAVSFNGRAREFYNSGTIIGDTGIAFGTGDSYLSNSGLIAGTDGTAIVFTGNNNTLAIGTGTRIVGEVDFGSGNNTYLDASAFHGSTIIEDKGSTLYTGNVIAGSNYYYQTTDEIFILSIGAVTQASQPVSNLVAGLGELTTSKLAFGDTVSTPDDLASAYFPTSRNAAESATRDAMAGMGGTTYWAEALGGVGRNADAAASDAYGALVAGAHTQLAAGATLGLMGGFAHTTLDIDNGAQTITSTVGIIGAYGSYDLGNLRTDFSLIGGLSGNDSDREVTIGDVTEIASASYGGWFIAPTIGAYVPVLTTDTGELSVGGRLGYLAGGFSGYTEDGSGLDVSVGDQRYGILTALLEVRGQNAISDTVSLNGSLGIFAQNQSGTATVSLADLAQPLVAPDGSSGTSLGLKAGIGADVAISEAFNIHAGVTGNWRSSGTAAASANLGIGGKF